RVATFVDNASTDPITNYSATIDWGDGVTNDPATVAPLGGGQFAVLSAAAHTYLKSGVFTLTVKVHDIDPADGVGSALVFVQPATVVLTPPTVQSGDNPAIAVEGKSQTFNLGTVTSSNPNAVASDFTVKVDWGDGSPQSVALVKPVIGSPGTFSLTA